ncbi:MAG: Trm112 family protein [Methanospirillum sp.]|nr:Trm112 family protein [Methanospirillum sp.]
MRRDLQEILCCPVCHGDLDLAVITEDEVEVLEGTLHCRACGIDYPIEDGIPNLLPPGEGAF